MMKKAAYSGVCCGGPWDGGCYQNLEPVFKLGPWMFKDRKIVGEYRFEITKPASSDPVTKWVWRDELS